MPFLPRFTILSTASAIAAQKRKHAPLGSIYKRVLHRQLKARPHDRECAVAEFPQQCDGLRTLLADKVCHVECAAMRRQSLLSVLLLFALIASAAAAEVAGSARINDADTVVV